MNIKLVVVDGSAFLFRAYFANLRQNLTNNEGFPTGAIFGTISSIKMLERKYPEAKFIIIFDAKGDNHRHALFADYKKNRKETDEDLKKQIDPLYDIIKAAGYNFLCIDNVEADDVIATICKQANNKKINTLIASSDKDLHQLVNNTTYQLNLKGDIIDKNAVMEKLGVRPDQVLDLLALSGDSADNIPGVPSVGIKTAAKWLKIYDNIDNLKQNATQITGKVGEKLRDNFAKLDLSYNLVKLLFNVELPYDVFNYKTIKNEDKLQQLFQLYGFNSWLKKDNNKENNNNLLDKYLQYIVTNKDSFIKLIDKLNNCNNFVFDLETTGLNYMNDKIVALVFLVDNSSYYVPIAHNYLGISKQLSADLVLNKLKPILTNKKIGKIGQNLKYDKHILQNHAIKLQGIAEDTILMSYCLNSTATKHNMDDLAKFYLNHNTIHFKDIVGSGNKQLNFSEVHIDKAAKYALEDVIITYELYLLFREKLVLKTPLYKLYRQIELPLIDVMVTIERNGVAINVAELLKQEQEIQQKLTVLKQQIYVICGCQFNIDSPKQLQQILFDKDGLNLSAKKTTKGGANSTNEEALKTLDHPIIPLLLSYRSFSKLSNTYLQVLPKNINQATQRLHCSYHQAGTATGRLSSTKPNLQNIPIRTIDGGNIRKAFIANHNYKILAADYSQIELRILAHISNDENLITAFKNNIDVHKTTASLMFDIDIKKITKEQRRSAKAINFGLIYGMGHYKLAKQLQITNTLAKSYIESYFANYPKIKTYIENTKNIAQQYGFVSTIYGRRLYVEPIKSNNKALAAHMMRAAINAPIQGSSADIIKDAMLGLQQKFANNNSIKMIMQVHDELVFEVEETKINVITQEIKQIMEGVVKLKVPLIVDIGIGNNWLIAH